MSSHDSAPVQRYYDNNTKLLLALGQGHEGTILRAVWGPGIRTRDDALAYVDELVGARVQQLQQANPSASHLLDLGCGVAATLCRIAKQTGIRGTGVTISARQHEIAKRRIEAAGMGDRVDCRQGDFCRLPSDIPQADLAYAIEAFVHAADARAFFAESARLIRPGGLLIVCDDFLADSAIVERPRVRYWIDRFRRGWVIGSLLDPQQLTSIANASGFVHDETVDLTSWLEIGRPRDWVIALLMRSLGWLPLRGSYWSMLHGGHALQVAINRGYIRYLFTVWRRAA